MLDITHVKAIIVRRYSVSDDDGTSRKPLISRDVVVVVVAVLKLPRIINSVVTGQVPVTLELRNTPGKDKQTEGGEHIYHS